MGAGELRKIHSRVSWIFSPVDKSITVSAPQHLDQKIAADDHRLRFRMIDIGRDYRAAARHLIAHKLRRDELRNGRAEAVSPVGSSRAVGAILQCFLATDVFPDRYVFHLGRNDALLGVVHLAAVTARLGAQDWPARR